MDPRVEAHVAAHLGLAREPVSTQVIPRDRHAAYFCTLAVVASGLERLATEVRHLQRSEVRELPTQRTQCYGNLWYRLPGARMNTYWGVPGLVRRLVKGRAAIMG